MLPSSHSSLINVWIIQFPQGFWLAQDWKSIFSHCIQLETDHLFTLKFIRVRIGPENVEEVAAILNDISNVEVTLGVFNVNFEEVASTIKYLIFWSIII